MVTFISQCEKKALTRTRKVLDAFADRIGTNTWQTVITQEGLLAVKKSLRKTATKNTAVSCHWIRSRSRSELVWVVGARDKFNFCGLVPVNTTEKEVFMDIQQPKAEKGVVYANTQLQRLEHHLFAVGFIAQKIYLHFYPNKTKQAKAAFIAGCFHDVGKLDPEFQSWVVAPKSQNYQAEDGYHIDKKKKFSFENHPRHNEISVLIFQCLSDQIKWLPPALKNSVKHAVYWHHARPFRPKNQAQFSTYSQIFYTLKNNLKDKFNTLISKNVVNMLNDVAKLDSDYREQAASDLDKSYSQHFDSEIIESYESTPLPAYKTYGQYEDLSDYRDKIIFNATNNEIRACLITADRWVSSLTAQDLASYIKTKSLDSFVRDQLKDHIVVENNLVAHIQECIGHFPNNERSQKQSIKARELADDNMHVKVLAGAAGCGKTKIALEWASLRNAQQIIWVCPRVQICQGLFTELRASDEPYFQQATVELFTGEFKYTNHFGNTTPEDEQLTGDIVITTIDQLLSSVISHTKADRLLNYLNAHIVFDEYHEYINMPAFNLLFAELVESRNELNGGCNILLVSATPHYAYLEAILDIKKDYDIVEMESFNSKSYQFNFVSYDENQEDETNPLYQKHKLSTFVISNTATTAQKSFIKNQEAENSILLHSKYKKSDKKTLFNQVFEAFKRDGNKEYDLLRSGPIVQASLNISCDHMVSEITTAENCLQRMGRLDRFGKNIDTNLYIVAIPDTLAAGKNNGAVARFLSSSNQLESAKAWLTFLIDKTENGSKTQTIYDIYQYYKEFYQSPLALRHIEQDMIVSMKKSAGIISNKVSEPQIIIRTKNSSQRKKISANALRGDSCFVQMAICDLTVSNNPIFLDKYSYEISATNENDIDNLTDSIDSLNNNGILDYAAQKHGRIDISHPVKGIPASKTSIRKQVLTSAARDPEYPVYLSYTESEMAQKLGETKPYSEAMFYIKTDKQAVGTLSLKHFIQSED
jgi:CRISPR-associated endonuclease/helicase Cas3